MISAEEALQRLKEGNEFFVNASSIAIETGEDQRQQLVGAQAPFAIILGCSDSRVPAELVFHCGLGELFVIRVAGNVVAPSQIGSVEFAAATFGTPLVVVLGHSLCGAIQATVDQLKRPTDQRSPNLRAIVDRISPAIAPLVENFHDADESSLVSASVKANVLASVDKLVHGSEILENLVAKEALMVVGAEYCLETGVVTFIER